jgi:hypothetical protein
MIHPFILILLPMILASCCPVIEPSPETNLEIDRSRCMEDYYRGLATQACARAMMGFQKRLEDKKGQKAEMDDQEKRKHSQPGQAD